MEGLRAYAATIVFLVHYLSNYAQKIKHVDLDSLTFKDVHSFSDAMIWYFFRSHYGVEIFFLLSGFLIFRMILRPGFSYSKFLSNRFFRIYPAFALSMFAIILASQGNAEFDWTRLIGNLLFLNAFPELHVAPINTPTWSLGFEFSYYLLIPILLALIGGRMRVSPLRVALLTGAAWLLLSTLSPFYMRFLMFFGGAFMASHSDEQLRHHASKFSDWSAVLVYIAVGAVFSFTSDFRIFVPIFLFGTYVLVLRSMYGNSLLSRLLSIPAIRIFGNLSYSFYLVHAFVINFVIWEIGFVLNWQLKIPIVGGLAYFATSLCLSYFLSLVISILLFSVTERYYFARRKVQVKTVQVAG